MTTSLSDAGRTPFESFVDAMPLAVMVHTMDYTIVAANRLCEDVLGCEVAQMIGRKVAEFVPVQDHESGRAMAAELAKTYGDVSGSGRPISSLRRIRRSDGSVLSCWMQVGLATIADERVIVACMDLVNPVNDSVRWRERAERDDLTGLLRRGPFLDRVDEWVAQDRPVTLAFVDVDRLKSINDTYGHNAGDVVLEAAARRLHRWSSPSAVVGRFAGDEFVVALRDGEGGAEQFVVDLRRAVCSEPVPWASELLVVSVSIGAVERGQGEASRDLIARADALMYRDKAIRRIESFG
ncbi:sensor domain-containing diguanylate cyclase [Rhodococcoides yunnanense]|uniref:sensor domain-containing diguanylate cyclase n=1 Tax=Rhodococcoides yunnanense TaxID=278209 RepID=UPI0009340DB2|nr:sensor domain-containing diguanylate cyclase [Rhodococcus yunnanensis]